MDEDATIGDLKRDVQVFCEARDWDQFHNAKELSIGILTEAAELLQHFRFKDERQVAELFADKRTELADEIADVLYFVLRLAQLYDVDLSTELRRKLEKNDNKYPVERARGSNKKYTEYEQ